MPIPHQAFSHRRSSAYDVLLHVSPGTSLTGLPASGTRRAEWRDAAWIHHLEVGKAIRRKSDGSFARPHKEGMPSAARARPHQMVLRTPQPGRSPLQIPLEPGLYSKVIRASTSAGPPIDPLYSFKCISLPNRYWKEPLGWPRAKPVGRAPEILNRQIQHLELAQIPGWIEGTAQIRQRNLQCRITPFPRRSAWKPQGKMTMSGDMSIVLHDEINCVLGPEARTEWEEHCLELEIASFPKWKRACELWSQPGWVSKRVSLEVESRAEIARQQAFAPAMVAPTMAMSLNQPVTIDLPTHVLEPEPISPPSSQASPQSSQQPQTGEHAAELTPDAALVQPIAELSLPEDLSDSETILTIVSPRRRASVATEDAEASNEAPKERARRSSAQ